MTDAPLTEAAIAAYLLEACLRDCAGDLDGNAVMAGCLAAGALLTARPDLLARFVAAAAHLYGDYTDRVYGGPTDLGQDVPALEDWGQVLATRFELAAVLAAAQPTPEPREH